METRLAVIGAPSSAAAYSPGQERAPAALRRSGLLEELRQHGIRTDDLGDTREFRWRMDLRDRRAMNVGAVAEVARSTAQLVEAALHTHSAVLVLGGDCTVELGTVAGTLRHTENIGLVYVDLDTDLNTPMSTTDGALDWMGVAHMLQLPNTRPELTDFAARQPMLRADQLCYFAVDNIEPFEREVIASLGLRTIRLHEVAAEPERSAKQVLDWSHAFDRLLVHLDVDVLDFLDMPIAENTRRNWGLRFEQLEASLQVLIQAPNWSSLTICELNPDHADSDGATLRAFVRAISQALALSPRLARTSQQ